MTRPVYINKTGTVAAIFGISLVIWWGQALFISPPTKPEQAVATEETEAAMETETLGDRVNLGVEVLQKCIMKSRLGMTDGVTTLQAYWADRLAILVCVEKGNKELGLSDDDIDPATAGFISQQDLIDQLETHRPKEES